MSQPQHISEIMHQLVLNNPEDPYAQMLRRCPCIQIGMLSKGYMSLDELSDEEISTLMDIVEPEVMEQIRRKEAGND